jgi:hypothetical protein
METRLTQDGVAVWGAAEDTAPGAGEAPATDISSAPSPEPASPLTPGPDTSALARTARVEALRTALLPQNRMQHTSDVLARLEAEYLREFAALRGLDAPPADVQHASSAQARTATATQDLDLAGYRARLGPERGRDGDIVVPDGYEWNPAQLNRAQAVLARHQFAPQHLDMFAPLTRALASREWVEEDAIAQLEQDYGKARADKMRQDAWLTWDLLDTMAEGDAEARALLDDLEDKQWRGHPGTVEALTLLYEDIKDHPRFRDAWVKRAARAS